MQWLIYPIIDFKNAYPSHQTYAKGSLFTLADKILCEQYYLTASHLDKNDSLISPIYGNLTALPPTYIVTAELDILIDEAKAYAQALKDEGNSVKVDRAARMPHGFINLIGVHPKAGHAAIDMIQAFKHFYDDTLNLR